MSITGFRWLLSIPCLAAAQALTACTPALNWREVRPEGSGLVALFPCKPDSHERPASLAGAKRKMTLYACETAGSTYAVSYADVEDAAAVESSLAALRQAAIDNMIATVRTEAPAIVAGMTPSPGARRLRFSGRLPSGITADAEAAFFCQGTRVFQATVVAPTLNAEALDAFFSALHFAG